jgi:hypothetical protein
MLGAGSMVSQGGRSLIRLATTAVMLSGFGAAGIGVYGDSLPPQATGAQVFIQEHSRELIIVGVALIVVGGILNFVVMRRMQKRMMANLPGMGQMSLGGMGSMGGAGGGMPGASMPFPNLAGMPGLEPQVKVRCPSCAKLQAEAATFCQDCGKPMVPVAKAGV